MNKCRQCKDKVALRYLKGFCSFVCKANYFENKANDEQLLRLQLQEKYQILEKESDTLMQLILNMVQILPKDKLRAIYNAVTKDKT